LFTTIAGSIPAPLNILFGLLFKDFANIKVKLEVNMKINVENMILWLVSQWVLVE
jgi:hypothetical protein